MTVELPDARPGRAAQIAALHAFADWFVAHPDVPMPTYVVAHYTVTGDERPSEAVRVHEVVELLEDLGVKPIEGPHSVQGDAVVAARAIHGVEICYRAAAMKDAPMVYLSPDRQVGRG